MKVVVLHATLNSPGKRDASGAFIPEARAFARARIRDGDEVVVLGFDNTIANRKRRRTAFFELLSREDADVFAYFGHGTRRGLPSAGVDLGAIDDFVAAMRFRTRSSARVVLYACSAGASLTNDTQGPGGDGGFADVLRDRLSEKGLVGWVDAHTTLGHTTRNPHVRRFYMDGVAVGTGGGFLVTPGSQRWTRWVARLRDELRFAFPFATEEEVRAALEPG